jgi:hypothetical protein
MHIYQRTQKDFISFSADANARANGYQRSLAASHERVSFTVGKCFRFKNGRW